MCIGIRIATKTARTQGTGQRGKKRAYLAQPGVKLGRLGLKLGNSGQLAPTWAQLEPNWGPTWRNLFGHVWTQVGLSMRNWVLCGASGAEVGPKTCRMGATWLQKPEKGLKIAVNIQKCLFSACLRKIGTSLAPRWPSWAPTWTHLGATLARVEIHMASKCGHRRPNLEFS